MQQILSPAAHVGWKVGPAQQVHLLEVRILHLHNTSTQATQHTVVIHTVVIVIVFPSLKVIMLLHTQRMSIIGLKVIMPP